MKKKKMVKLKHLIDQRKFRWNKEYDNYFIYKTHTSYYLVYRKEIPYLNFMKVIRIRMAVIDTPSKITDYYLLSLYEEETKHPIRFSVRGFKFKNKTELLEATLEIGISNLGVP